MGIGPLSPFDARKQLRFTVLSTFSFASLAEVMPIRILIVGNSGSGKSTLARELASEHCLVHLDLDTIVWESGSVAIQRPIEAAHLLLAEFVEKNKSWVIEGCYGELIRRLLPDCTELVFLNPGLEACLKNNRTRPWEPLKYTSIEAQNEMLPQLQEWVASYYEREDDWSYSAHRKLFQDFAGRKRELTGP
jgi:adenylate kinase family enzyme